MKDLNQKDPTLKSPEPFWPQFVLRVFETAEEMAEGAVLRFLELAEGQACRLALPTGRTFIPFYGRLAERCRQEPDLDLSAASGFNVDELVLPKGHPKTFAAYMEQHVWSQTSLQRTRFHIPAVESMTSLEGGSGQQDVQLEGGKSNDALAEVCRAYDTTMAEFQPLDLALLGVGADGHVGYNLPGPPHQKTHAVELSDSLAEELKVPGPLRPLRAVTMGFGPLQAAHHILLLASGASKAASVRQLIYGPADPQWPCTLLRDHPGFEVYVDREALGSLAFDPARGFPAQQEEQAE